MSARRPVAPAGRTMISARFENIDPACRSDEPRIGSSGRRRGDEHFWDRTSLSTFFEIFPKTGDNQMNRWIFVRISPMLSTLSMLTGSDSAKTRPYARVPKRIKSPFKGFSLRKGFNPLSAVCRMLKLHGGLRGLFCYRDVYADPLSP